MSGPRFFGLRFYRDGREVRLWQISGSGRIRLRNAVTGEAWWSAPPRGVQWEVFPTNEGHIFSNPMAAQEVVENLERR
jgi:hypothetical protein